MARSRCAIEEHLRQNLDHYFPEPDVDRGYKDKINVDVSRQSFREFGIPWKKMINVGEMAALRHYRVRSFSFLECDVYENAYRKLPAITFPFKS